MDIFYSPRRDETIPPKFHLIPPKFHLIPPKFHFISTWRFENFHVGIYLLPSTSKWKLASWLQRWRLVYLRNCSTFATTSEEMCARELRRITPSVSRQARRGGRVVDRGGLENRWPSRVRGFESLPLRFKYSGSTAREHYRKSISIVILTSYDTFVL